MLKLGSTTTVQALGKSWTFGRNVLGVIEDFRAWIFTKEPDPFALCDRYLGKIAEAEWNALFKEAKAKRDDMESVMPGTPLWNKWLLLPEGAAQMAWLLLREHHPEVTREDALRVFAEIGIQEFAGVLANGTGQVPNGAAPAMPGARGKASTGTSSTAV